MAANPIKMRRNLTGRQLATSLRKLDYVVVRQAGSHIRLQTERDGRKPLSIQDHAPLKVGTLSGILREVAKHHGMTRDALLALLFDAGAKS